MAQSAPTMKAAMANRAAGLFLQRLVGRRAGEPQREPDKPRLAP